MSSFVFDVKGDGMIALNILKNNIRSYLSRVIPGLITRIEWHFLRKYSRSFIDLIFEEPSLVLKELMDFYGGDADSAEYILYFALKIIFIQIYGDTIHRYLRIRKYSTYKTTIYGEEPYSVLNIFLNSSLSPFLICSIALLISS